MYEKGRLLKKNRFNDIIKEKGVILCHLNQKIQLLKIYYMLI